MAGSEAASEPKPGVTELKGEVSALLAEKKRALTEANESHFISGALKTTGGVVMGVMGSLAAMSAVVGKRLYDLAYERVPKMAEMAERNLPKGEMEQKIAQDMINVLERENSLAANMMRTPGTTIVVGAVLGGGAALLEHTGKWGQRREEAKRDVDVLTKVEGSWADRAEKKEPDPDKPKACSKCAAARGG